MELNAILSSLHLTFKKLALLTACRIKFYILIITDITERKQNYMV